MNSKPSLKDRRRTEAREALYRAQERREHLIASLVRNANQITTLKRRLKHLDAPVGNAISPLPVSVAEGKLLDHDTLALVTRMTGELDDDIPNPLGGQP